jgi:ArsR family transcriptional regulator
MNDHDAVRVLKALGDANRLRIARALAARRACVCELAHALGLSQPNLSRHLRVLENAGLVVPRKEGAWTEYRLAAGPAAPLIRWLARATGEDEQARADAAALARADRRRLCGTGSPKPRSPRGT